MNFSYNASKSGIAGRDFRAFSATGAGRRFARFIVLLMCLVWVAASSFSWGQTTTASIAGTVTDPTQAVIPNATVTATNTSTGVVNTTKTDSSGHYAFLSLPVGTYLLTVAQPGFQTSQISEITLRVDQQVTQNITLSIGG